MVAHFLQNTGVKVQIGVFSKIATAKTGLQGKRIHDLELFPPNDSAGSFLGFLDTKRTVNIAENLSLLLQHIRKNPLSVSGVIFCAVSVHENVLFSGVPVEITKEQNFALSLGLFYSLLHMKQYRMSLLRRLLPLPVEVLADQRAPGVAKDDAIWIDHGNDFENEVVTQDSGTDAGANQVVNDALHHVRSSSFTRVDSSAEDDGLFWLHSLLRISKSSYGQYIYNIPSISLAQHFPAKSIFGLLVIFKFAQIPLQIGVRIRVAVRKKAGVTIMVELDAESQGVKMATWLFYNVVLVIADVLTNSVPALTAGHGVDVGVHERLHSVVVETVWLQQIDNVESVGSAFLGIWDLKIEPLVVKFGIIIGLEDEVIFKLVYLYGPSQVSTFKPTFEA